MVNLHNQVLSRNVALGLGESQTVLDFNRPGQLWRLSVQELDSASAVLVTVTTGFPNSEEKIEFHCGPGGGVEYAGSGSATVDLSTNAATNVMIQLSPHYDSQFHLERDGGRQTVNNAAYVPLGPNPQGQAPPYMNYVAIMTDANIDVRTVNLVGNVVFEGLALPPQLLLLNQFKFGNQDLIEVRGSAVALQPVRAVWYNRR